MERERVNAIREERERQRRKRQGENKRDKEVFGNCA